MDSKLTLESRAYFTGPKVVAQRPFHPPHLTAPLSSPLRLAGFYLFASHGPWICYREHDIRRVGLTVVAMSQGNQIEWALGAFY